MSTNLHIDGIGNLILRDGKLGLFVSSQYVTPPHYGGGRVGALCPYAVEQVNHYYAYGGIIGNLSSNQEAQKYKYSGKELDRTYGLDLMDFHARQYDGLVPNFTSIDPLAEKDPSVSPYAYCAGNPVNCVDPDGMETRVIQTEDGTYQVIGGVLNDDRNIYLYTQDEEGNYTVRGASIGQTTSTTSFWNSDQANNEYEGWAVGSIINPNDNSGISFLNKMVSSEVTLDQYLDKARNNQPWDFKVTNGSNQVLDIDIYRGMPIGSTIDGSPLYTSARDVGNMGAGIVAAKNGISWGAARIAFDIYQGGPEGISTRNAEAYGWSMVNRHLASPNMVHSNITNTIKHFIQNILR